MYTIRQTLDGWELTGADGAVLAAFPTYAAALDRLATVLAEHADGAEEMEPDAGTAGVLPERWMSVPGQGIAFTAETGDGRDFTQVAWSWRDPQVSLLPLMYQDHTDMGHMGAVLAGYIDRIGLDGDRVVAGGGFYDTAAGREARDLLLDGRRFGVSVDPGMVEAREDCLQTDEDGWCVDARLVFDSYEVIGLTMTPFPAFAEAAIQIGDEPPIAVDDDEPEDVPDEDDAPEDVDDPEAVTAAARPAPGEVPADWFTVPEPQIGEFAAWDDGSMGEEWLIDQGQGRVAMPLTILPNGQVLGHLAAWDTCHTGYANQCVAPPSSPSGYARFHTGQFTCADGTVVNTGPLTAGCDHAAMRATAAQGRDHYANLGFAWADVRVVDGVHGPWMCGVLRSHITDEQVEALRASAPSGDWRNCGGTLDLIGVLAVSTPGFPVARQPILASGTPLLSVHEGVRTVQHAGAPMALVASSGWVRRCADCASRAAAATHRVTKATMTVDVTAPALAAVTDALQQVAARLDVLDRRTRSLNENVKADLAARLRAGDAAPRDA